MLTFDLMERGDAELERNITKRNRKRRDNT
nr:MAG TPA: hypothetical protein [Caudoviricetes sp.]